jgi:hypothetical protein
METDAPPVTGNYRASVRDYIRHAPALKRGTRFSNGFGALAALLAVLSLPYLVPVALELALAVALLSGYYTVPFTWLGLRSKRRLVEQQVEVVADAGGVQFTHAVSHIDIPWDEISRVRETHDCFFVMADHSRAYILPKRAFGSSQLEAFKRLAESKGKIPRG